jgi:hypothetical protein
MMVGAIFGFIIAMIYPIALLIVMLRPSVAAAFAPQDDSLGTPGVRD